MSCKRRAPSSCATHGAESKPSTDRRQERETKGEGSERNPARHSFAPRQHLFHNGELIFADESRTRRPQIDLSFQCCLRGTVESGQDTNARSEVGIARLECGEERSSASRLHKRREPCRLARSRSKRASPLETKSFVCGRVAMRAAFLRERILICSPRILPCVLMFRSSSVRSVTAVLLTCEHARLPCLWHHFYFPLVGMARGV